MNLRINLIFLSIFFGSGAFAQLDSIHVALSDYFNLDNDEPAQPFAENYFSLSFSFQQQVGLTDLYSPQKMYLLRELDMGTNGAKGALIALVNDSPNDCAIIFVVYNQEFELIFHHLAAKYVRLEGTMEETSNSWIYDYDKDGDLDFIHMNSLIDYELSFEMAPNISGWDAFLYLNNQGIFEYDYPDQNTLKSIHLIK